MNSVIINKKARFFKLGLMAFVVLTFTSCDRYFQLDDNNKDAREARGLMSRLVKGIPVNSQMNLSIEYKSSSAQYSDFFRDDQSNSRFKVVSLKYIGLKNRTVKKVSYLSPTFKLRTSYVADGSRQIRETILQPSTISCEAVHLNDIEYIRDREGVSPYTPRGRWKPIMVDISRNGHVSFEFPIYRNESRSYYREHLAWTEGRVSNRASVLFQRFNSIIETFRRYNTACD